MGEDDVFLSCDLALIYLQARARRNNVHHLIVSCRGK